MGREFIPALHYFILAVYPFFLIANSYVSAFRVLSLLYKT